MADEMRAPGRPGEPRYERRFPAQAAGLTSMAQELARLAQTAGFPSDALPRVRIGVLEAGRATVIANGGGDYVEVVARVRPDELWIVLSQEDQGLCSRPSSDVQASIRVAQRVCDVLEPMLVDGATAFCLRFWPGDGPL